MSFTERHQRLKAKHEADLAKLEEAAYRAFLKLRWPPNGKPICPKCGYHKFYAYLNKKGRRCFNCKYADCRHHYTATSRTVFASRKLTYANLMLIIEAITNNPDRSVRDITIKEIGRTHNQYRTVWLLSKKIAEMQEIGRVTQQRSQYVGYRQYGPAPHIRKRKAPPMAKALLTEDLIAEIDLKHEIFANMKGYGTPGRHMWRVHDTVVIGLALRVGRAAKTWTIRLGLRHQNNTYMTLGRWPEMSLEQARVKAAEISRNHTTTEARKRLLLKQSYGGKTKRQRLIEAMEAGMTHNEAAAATGVNVRMALRLYINERVKRAAAKSA